MTLRLRFHNTYSEAEPEAEQAQEREQVRVSLKSELPQHALARSCTFLKELRVCPVDGERRDPVLRFVFLVSGGKLMTSSKYFMNTPT